MPRDLMQRLEQLQILQLELGELRKKHLALTFDLLALGRTLGFLQADTIGKALREPDDAA